MQNLTPLCEVILVTFFIVAILALVFCAVGKMLLRNLRVHLVLYFFLLYLLWWWTDAFLFYTMGMTSCRFRSIVFVILAPPDDMCDSIVSCRLKPGQAKYSFDVIHKYDGEYCLWIGSGDVSSAVKVSKDISVNASFLDERGSEIYELGIGPSSDSSDRFTKHSLVATYNTFSNKLKTHRKYKLQIVLTGDDVHNFFDDNKDALIWLKRTSVY